MAMSQTNIPIEDPLEEVRTTDGARDYITWVGGRYYTASTFITEAKTLGICRRTPFVPEGLRIGKTRIFFVTDLVGEAEKHVKAVTHKKAADEIKKYRSFRVNRLALERQGIQLIPHVIGYGVITGVLVVGYSKLLSELRQKGVTVLYLSPTNINKVPPRGCGTLRVGGTYLIDTQTLQSLIDTGAIRREDITGLTVHPSTFVELNPPIPAPGLHRWRGLKMVDGDKILQGRPWQEWFEER